MARENKTIKEFCLFYFAISCIWKSGYSEVYSKDCEVELISLSGLNTVRNCAVTFLCKSTSDCDKDIQYKTRNTAWIEMEESACAEDMTWKNCSHKFLENSSVNCIASIAGRQSKIQEIKVLDHLEQVKNIHKMDDCVSWSPLSTYDGIKVEYIKSIYINGKIIKRITNASTEYCFPNKFNDCELFSLKIEAKTVCGDVSSNSASWSESLLSPQQIPRNLFDIKLSQVKSGVSISISHKKTSTCARRPRASSAKLFCNSTRTGSSVNYMNVIQDGEEVQFKAVAVLSNDRIECELSLINEAGKTAQWKEKISTYQVQKFHITKVNDTYICTELNFLEGSTYKKCSVKLNDSTSYSFEISKGKECHSIKLPIGQHHYCLKCDDGEYDQDQIRTEYRCNYDDAHANFIADSVSVSWVTLILSVAVSLIVNGIDGSHALSI